MAALEDGVLAGRIEGLEEPRLERAERTEGAARGSASMGMLGHLERRRDWSLRWSFQFSKDVSL